jgi:hypothetical protein
MTKSFFENFGVLRTPATLPASLADPGNQN